MVIKVSKEICKRIKTAQDLNDFYAYCERFGDNPTYEFESDNERIDELVNHVCYTGGVYVYENVKRILGLKEYYIKLTDTDTEEVRVWLLETNKTLKDFEKAYKKARNDWYEKGLDALDEYLLEKLDKKGFVLTPLEMDLEVDF